MLRVSRLSWHSVFAGNDGKVGMGGHRCEGAEEKPLLITFFSQTDPRSAMMTFGNLQAILFSEVSASGARYTGPDVEFWEHQGEATVDFYGEKLRCKVRSSG